MYINTDTQVYIYIYIYNKIERKITFFSFIINLFRVFGDPFIYMHINQYTCAYFTYNPSLFIVIFFYL